MRRRRRHAAHVNHERWLVSYADFITLLFAVFVVLYASAHVDNKRIGDTPRDVPKLVVGPHRVLLVNEDAGIKKYATVTIHENKTEPYHYEHKSP